MRQAREQPDQDAVFRARLVRTLRAHGFDLEAAAPPGWWRGLASADERRFTAAWDALEDVTEALVPGDVWGIALAACFTHWPGPWFRVFDEGGTSNDRT